MAQAYVPPPSYNMGNNDPWSALARGMQIGGALRQQSRERQYGAAYQQNGWGGVADAAGGQGDLGTASDAQQQQSQAQETMLARGQRNAQVLSNVATSLMQVPYEQRRARIQQMTPMLAQMGLPEDQIAGFDPTDEALDGIRGIHGQFSQYTDIRSGQNGELVGVRPDGSTEVIHQGQQPAPSGYQWNQDNSAVAPIPGYQGPVGGGGAGYGRAPSGYQWNEDGSLSPIRGGPRDPSVSPRQSTFGPDQRARAAITYQNANDAVTQLQQLEEGGYNLGQDWGAVAVENMSDGNPNSMAGMVARNWGGQDYQQMRAATSAFESAMLPILSGAAVTESEALRTIRGALPQAGDGPEVTRDKQRRRQQMLNGAALIYGTAPPYPDLGVPPWAERYLQNMQTQGGADQAPVSGAPDQGQRVLRWNPQTGQLE